MKKEHKLRVGVKWDENKLRWDLLPLEPIESIIKVLMLGSKKYGDYNWQVVPDCQRRYYSAAMRHLTAWFFKEKIDPESGESHLAHAATCLIFMMWHEQEEKRKLEARERAEELIEEEEDDQIEEEDLEDDNRIGPSYVDPYRFRKDSDKTPNDFSYLKDLFDGTDIKLTEDDIRNAISAIKDLAKGLYSPFKVNGHKATGNTTEYEVDK